MTSTATPTIARTRKAESGRAAHGVQARPDGRTVQKARGPTVAILVYLLLAGLAGGRVLLDGGTTHVLFAGNGDVEQSVWFLAQTPYALLHGVNPLVNNWLHYPSGANLVDNTTMPLLGLLAAPVTLTFGPVLAFNLLVLLGFTVSATVAFLVFRSFVSGPAAFVGGLIYGFSPYMVGQAQGHVMLTWVPIPPLVLYLGKRVLVERAGSPWRYGLLIGGALVAQLFIDAEVFTSMVVMIAVAVILILGSQILARQRTRSRLMRTGTTAVAEIGGGEGPTRCSAGRHVPGGWGYLGISGTTAVAVVAVGAVYPLWLAAAGPQHLVGPAQPVHLLEGLSSDVLTPIVPTVNQQLSFGLAATGTRMVAEHDPGGRLFVDGPEDGGYMGIPLLVLLVGAAAVMWRRAVVRFSLAMGVVALVLSAGSDLHYDGRYLGVPMPFSVLTHLPFLDSQVASRYSLYVWLAVALLIGLFADSAWWWLRQRFVPVVAYGALMGALVLALVPLLPVWPYPSGGTAIPAWFTSPAVRAVPVGSTLLTFPFPAVGNPVPMLWQAVDGMRYRMPGGYLNTPTASGEATMLPTSTPVTTALLECGGGINPGTPAPPAVADARATLVAWNVSTVVVPRTQQGARCAIAYVRALLGPPRGQDGSDVWEVDAHTGTSR